MGNDRKVEPQKQGKQSSKGLKKRKHQVKKASSKRNGKRKAVNPRTIDRPCGTRGGTRTTLNSRTKKRKQKAKGITVNVAKPPGIGQKKKKPLGREAYPRNDIDSTGAHTHNLAQGTLA